MSLSRSVLVSRTLLSLAAASVAGLITGSPADATAAGAVNTAIAYARNCIGAPYGWWTGGEIPEGPPMYHTNGPPPSAQYVKDNGVNCSGLTNLMRRRVGLTSIGGTGAYGSLPGRKAFVRGTTYPKGTLIGRYYRDVNDQGHVAVVTDNQYVIQSYADCYLCTTPGCNEWWTVSESDAGWYYEYYILPGDWLPETATTKIVDNSSSNFSVSSNWATATSAADKYGSDYRYRSTAAISDPAKWSFTTPYARPYALYAWWSQGANRSATAPYVLLNGSTVNKNQQANGGKWNLLGTNTSSYSWNNIKLSCWTTTGYVVIADAIKAVPQ